MVRTRHAFAAILLVGLISTAGCLGTLTGDQPLSQAATSASVGDDALSETDYELADQQSVDINQSVQVAAQTHDLETTNALTHYHRTVDLGLLGEHRAAVFTVFSTPAFEVAGHSFSPVKGYSNRRIAELVGAEYNTISIGEQVDNRTVTVLGEETEVSKYSGTARFVNTDIDVYVHLTKVRHDGDYVIAIAVHPQDLPGEQERVDALLKGIEHPDSSS